MGINSGLRIICAKNHDCVYLDTPNLFCKNHDPQPKFFADGLHLTNLGKSILGGRFRQSYHQSQLDLYFGSKLYVYLRDEY